MNDEIKTFEGTGCGLFKKKKYPSIYLVEVRKNTIDVRVSSVRTENQTEKLPSTSLEYSY
jgi:hypothetical protein